MNATTATCLSPAHTAATVDIVFTNADTQSSTLPASYTYRPAPVLSSLSPVAGALGGNTVLTLTGTGFVAGATVTVGGGACTAINVVNSTTITCSTPSHSAATVDVTVTNADHPKFDL